MPWPYLSLPSRNFQRRSCSVSCSFSCRSSRSLRLLDGSCGGRLHFVEVNHLAHERGFGSEFAGNGSAAMKFAECAAPGEHVHFDAQLVAGNHGAAEAPAVDGDKVEQFFL